MLTHGSLFTGVGGIDIGFDAAGIETLWQCEINAQCRSVLAKHWPNATRYEDVSAVKGDEIKPVDIITFGSPCQDLSIAGKRAGFQDGTRSNLYFEAIRIIEEMRNATENQYPRIAVWENVRGALSSRDGADFEAALQALADIGAVDISWRVVNTCNFGPPQRRVRVFVVADFGGECAGEVLAQSTRVLWHPASRNASQQDAADQTTDSTGSGGCGLSGDRVGSQILRRGDVEIALGSDKNVSNALTASLYHHGTVVNQDADSGQLVCETPATRQHTYKDLSNCLSTSNNRIDYETETFIVESFCASSFGMYTPGVGPLRAKGGDNLGAENIIVESVPYVKVVRSGARDENGELPAEVWRAEQVSPTLNVFDNGGESRATVVSVFSYDGYNQKLEADGTYRTLRTGYDSSDFVAQIDTPSSRVRRLTPRECERLQGWPDDHTRYADTGKELSDSARYKMCGNGVSAPVAQWIGENIVGALKND